MVANAKIHVENLYKIFGDNPEAALALARQGQSKDIIFRETGGVVAVNDISFTVPEREVFVVMGLSGSGKSTLVRCINRLYEPTGGRILFHEQDVVRADAEQLRQLRYKMAMVFQHFALFPHRTVLENVEYGLKIRRVNVDERRDRAMEALRIVDLEAWADVYPRNLSGGMQQRVGLARGLAVSPEVLLMDEPFSALDPLIRRDMQDQLLKIQERFQTTIIFITHDLHEALKLGHQIAIMKDGRFVQVGTPEQIVNQPADDYVAAFTRDVDRSRVLSLGSVMGEPMTVTANTLLATVRQRLQTLDLKALYVTNSVGKPQGLITSKDVQNGADDQPVKAIMRREFPSAGVDQQLCEVYGCCSQGLPLAVLDNSGHLVGVVRPLDVFEHLDTKEAAA